ncbi:MAG TPA: hypothetical protein VMZ25_01805, partial [Terriglobales bacterium]|nr:hypothetical protein [Terriglobales bacterium]
TFTVNQNFSANVDIATTTASTAGVITSGASRYIHNFGTNNFFAGVNSGNFTLTGAQNVGVGPTALTALTSGASNTAVGRRALQTLTSGSFNTAVGNDALLNVTTTTDNTAVGWSAMLVTTTGSQNTAIGKSSLQSNIDGFENVGLGVNALFGNTSGFENTGIGTNALRGVTTGRDNTAIGRNAGYTLTPANADTTGNFNTFLGYNTGFGSSTQFTNATAIGANAVVTQSNALILGNNADVGIGTSTPSAKLHVVGNILATGTISGNGSSLTNVASVPATFTQAQPALTAISTTTLTTPASAGLYRATCYVVNTSTATGPFGAVSIHWTDDSGTAQTSACATFSGQAAGQFNSGSVIVQSGASAITFDATSHASAYKIYISLEKLM